MPTRTHKHDTRRNKLVVVVVLFANLFWLGVAQFLTSCDSRLASANRSVEFLFFLLNAPTVAITTTTIISVELSVLVKVTTHTSVVF